MARVSEQGLAGGAAGQSGEASNASGRRWCKQTGWMIEPDASVRACQARAKRSEPELVWTALRAWGAVVRLYRRETGQ